MASPLLVALRETRARLAMAPPLGPGETSLAKGLLRHLDDAIARLEGRAQDKDLVSIVCHDLKDPLASIVVGASFLKKTIPSSDAGARRVLDAMGRSVDRMTRVVGDFHDLAKLEAGTLVVDLKLCDVAAAVRGVFTSFEERARARDIELAIESPGETLGGNSGGNCCALCDPARLGQAAGELVGNALRFTAKGGRVTARVASEGDRISVSVADTGCGIPPERLPTIFDHRTNAARTPRDGPGLGLAIVRGIVELHGGEVAATSRVGEGSTFAFTLPRA